MQNVCRCDEWRKMNRMRRSTIEKERGNQICGRLMEWESTGLRPNLEGTPQAQRFKLILMCRQFAHRAHQIIALAVTASLQGAETISNRKWKNR